MKEETIVAVSTPPGRGGIAVVRLSGPDAFAILAKCWKGAPIAGMKSHTVHLGWIVDADGADIDQVVLTLYRAPRSFTGEDVAEISCHGSPWIQQSVVNRLTECGARAAGAGEFTRRAFMNGRLDLAQAEGVADLIAASSRAAARLAATQLRGDFSRRLDEMRESLVELGSLLELELDFSEEDVEFADRSRLIDLTATLRALVDRLAASYKSGNAFKHGVPVVIAGVPNAGKSTLLNALIGEEKAIVSDIPGTTRDVIEDTVEIGGILFRFFDTAGLRESDDVVETIGVDRARRKISEAEIVLRLVDPTQELAPQMGWLPSEGLATDRKVVTVVTKTDVAEASEAVAADGDSVRISAATGAGLDALRKRLVALATAEFDPQQELIVTNARHYEALLAASEALGRLAVGLEEGVPTDFLAQDLREATHHIGTITGRVTTDDLLQSIFSRYCIGK